MSSEEVEQEVKEITIVVRSLITSTKPPVSLARIERDYMSVEQQRIPYRRLGFRNTLELLQGTNAFDFQWNGTDVIVSAKPNPKSAHIASMVRFQKCSGKNKISSFSRPQAAPVQNVRPIAGPSVFTNGQGYHPKKQQAAQQAAQQQQAERQSLLDKELHRLRQELAEQQRELREQQEKQLNQQRKTEQQITELQQKHELGLRVQADTIEKLKTEHLKLQRLLKQQREQQKQQLAKEVALAQQKEQESLRKRVDLCVKTKKEENETEQKSKSRTSSTAIPASTKLVEMNGNAASSRKPHLRPILGNSAPQRQTPPMPQPTTDTTAAVGNANRRLQHPRVQYPGARSTSGISVNYRLKQQQTAIAVTTPAAPLIITPPDSPESAANSKESATTKAIDIDPTSFFPLQAVRPNVNFKFDPAYDAISSLKQYCVALGYAPPEYEFTNVIKGNRLHCKVRIGANIYTSYPEEHADEATAKQRTSEVAIERLKQLQARGQLAVLSDAGFLDSLFQELVKHPHGIVSHKLAEWYEATVKRQVPNNWWALIKASPKVRIESSVNTNIVFANTPTESGLSSSISSPNQQQQHQQLQQYNVDTTAMPELQLPWVEGQQDWSMYITHCDSTMHVWARLIEQSANFEKLTEQLNAYMSRKQNQQLVQQPHPIEQQIYLVEVSENWNRVRVMSVDAEQRQCSCHFIDFGDEVTFSFDALYLCPSQFLALPAQAVCLSMYALDKFEEHPHALPVLVKELAGHSVVTRIITSEIQFHKLGGRTQGVLLQLQQQQEQDVEKSFPQPTVRRACIVGTFYDTSTAEDIHLNDLVANRIIRSTPAPMLKLDQKSNHVLVSHVNDVGDLMVQLPNEDLKFVQRSIARIMSDANEQHRVRYTDLLHDQLVCVCDESGDGAKQWYRGMLTAKPKSAEEEVFDVYYVDDGRLRKTHISNIYRLEANNLALASYPAQALRVRLHDVPPIDNQMVGRLRGLLSPQTPVLLKVMEGANDKLPMVTIHARGQDSLYLCLNSAIRMEYEVQSTTRLEPFDDGGLHFSPTGQLIRRSSFSSTLSSHSSSSSDQTTIASLASPPSTPRKAATASSPATALLPLLKEYEAIPAIGAYFEVRVALSVNPGHFAVQPYKCYNQLQRLMKDLQAHCKSTAAQTVLPAQLAIGQAFAAADTDGVYHRVNIRKIYDEMIQVRYVDAGDDAVVRCNQLLQLTPEFRELPMMALPAQLHGIQVADIDWTQENCVRFRKLTLGQKFIGIVRRVDKLKDDRRALSLELIDTSTPQDIKVHETLISEKHALPAP
ncbi:hypothetical protein KR222_004306 [Zaprionus bogoriensis]|nr:hypothetical protein KR222_004306 [Zaprionus bogoriensis]